MEERQITLVAFGSAVEALGFTMRAWPLPSGGTLADLTAELEQHWPRVRAARGLLRFAVNQRYATGDTALQPGDEVAIIPPVSGGSSRSNEVRLISAEIDPDALVQFVADPSAGAVATFLGTVRAETAPDGRELEALDYSAYEEMALAEMRRLCAELARPDQRIGLVHRLGRLEIGDASIAIAVSSPHRAEAFDVCRAIIERVKADVPIFKREIWREGAPTWVRGI